MSKVKALPNILDKIYMAYHENPGKMLIHTGVIGWMMSSAAQIAGIVFNDKISKEQKMFLVPQEFADACVNTISFYFVTRTFTALGEKLVASGKWLPLSVKNYLVKKGFGPRLGNPDFNVLRDANLNGKLKKTYSRFNAGIDIAATTIGTVLSCNVITPLARNFYASKRQQSSIARMNDKEMKSVDYTKYQPLKPSITTFTSGGSLKV